jgi:hypothetical protein
MAGGAAGSGMAGGALGSATTGGVAGASGGVAGMVRSGGAGASAGGAGSWPKAGMAAASKGRAARKRARGRIILAGWVRGTNRSLGENRGGVEHEIGVVGWMGVSPCRRHDEGPGAFQAPGLTVLCRAAGCRPTIVMSPARRHSYHVACKATLLSCRLEGDMTGRAAFCRPVLKTGRALGERPACCCVRGEGCRGEAGRSEDRRSRGERCHAGRQDAARPSLCRLQGDTPIRYVACKATLLSRWRAAGITSASWACPWPWAGR